MKADAYAYRDRRNRKRDFRRLWITRINAAARQNGMTYGDVHPRPEAGRHRAGPQGPGRHRRARPRDLPPICRRRPRGVGRRCLAAEPTPSTSRAPLPHRTAPFLFTTITRRRSPAPHNDKLKEIRRLAAPSRSDALRRRGRGPRRGRRRGRAGAAGCYRLRGRASTSSRRCSTAVSALGSGTRVARRLRAALRRARRPAAASRSGASATRATSARCCARALAFGAACVALGPGLRRPVRPEGGARVDGRDLRAARRARGRPSAELPGARIALVARDRRAAARARSTGP